MSRCQRCKSNYIVDGICHMCGFVVWDGGYLAPRKCSACGRTLRFEGSICYACSEAIALGADAVAENARRYHRDCDLGQAGFCPAAAMLEGKTRRDYKRLAVPGGDNKPPKWTSWQRKYHTNEEVREKALAYAREYRKKNRERLKAYQNEYQRVYKVTHRDEICARQAAYYAANRERWRRYHEQEKERRTHVNGQEIRPADAGSAA